MNVDVEKIDTNPYRNIGKYPINREKVEALKTSIGQTGFWDNILIRPNGNRFQLAYGHHRLVAIKELGIENVDVPVRDLDDATMLRIMANENMDEWRASPAVINETVFAAKKFIDSELAKYETREAIPANSFISQIASDAYSFANLKKQGAGQTTILAFLGGNWKQWMIQEALETLKLDKEKRIDRKAVEVIKSVEAAKHFKSAVKELDIPIDEQYDIACQIVEEGRDSKREIGAAVRQIARYTESVKRFQAKEEKENKKLPIEHPKAVKDYLSACAVYRDALELAIRCAKQSMFAPEAVGIIKTKHNAIRELMKEMEEQV